MYTERMSRVRRIAGPLAAIWLLMQTATLLVVPAVFYAQSGTAPIECTCVHDGNHHDCPMHHSSPVGARVCSQTTGSGDLAAIGSMLGDVGLVPGPPNAVFLTTTPLAVQRDASSIALRPAPPDPPPPRA